MKSKRNSVHWAVWGILWGLWMGITVPIFDYFIGGGPLTIEELLKSLPIYLIVGIPFGFILEIAYRSEQKAKGPNTP